MRIAAIGRGTEEAVVEGAVIRRLEGTVFGTVGGAAFGGKAMFFAGEDVCKEKYPGLYSKRGLDERRRSLHLPIKRRPLLRISRNDRVSPSDSLGSL